MSLPPARQSNHADPCHFARRAMPRIPWVHVPVECGFAADRAGSESPMHSSVRAAARRRSPSAWHATVDLAPGEYLVEAAAPGFQSLAQTVELSTGQRARIDFALAVGGVGETVTVEAATPLLDTQSAALGTVVARSEIANLPLAIRNWDDLLFTLPGVQGDRYTEQTGTTNAGRTGGVSVHGNRSLQNNFLLDGVDNNSISTNVQELSTQVSRPSIDAIGEFKVVTSPFAAEYGRAPGGAIVVTTKSGTNQLRGTVYDYFRDEQLRLAHRSSPKRSNLDKPTNDQNQFGVNLGGPIVANRAFFFGDFEATRITQGVLRTGRVTTADERSGVFAVRDPRPADRPAVRRTTRSRPTASIRWRAASWICCRCPTRPAPTTSSASPTWRTTASATWLRVDFKPGAERQRLRALHLHRPHAVRARLLRRRARRHVDVGLGPQLPDVAQHRRRLDQGARARRSSTRSASRGPAAISDGQQDPFGEDGMAQIGFKGVPAESGGARRHRRRRHHRPPPARLAELHAEVPAHRSGAVPRHAVVAARQPPAEGRHRHHGADEQRVRGHPVDARQSAASPASSPATRSPTSCSATPAGRAVERAHREPAPLGDGLLRPGRLARRPTG